MSFISGHMVRRSKSKTRNARVVARKPSVEKRSSLTERGSGQDLSGILIELYLELGLPWPNAMRAAVADLRQLYSINRHELLSPA